MRYPPVKLDILLPWENLKHLSYHFYLESSQFTTDLANGSVCGWGWPSDWYKANLRSLELKFQLVGWAIALPRGRNESQETIYCVRNVLSSLKHHLIRRRDWHAH